MAKYHKYVFDEKSRRLVGDFEEMYQKEAAEGFDSWHQEDSRHLNRRIISSLFEQFNFDSVVDLGCGKGSLTQNWKKYNNHVLGIDLSETALGVARCRYPDIDFIASNINETEILTTTIKRWMNDVGLNTEKVDVFLVVELLSYVELWKDLLQQISELSRYVLLSLYLPPNPMGYVKTFEELHNEIGINFRIVEYIKLETSGFCIILGESL